MAIFETVRSVVRVRGLELDRSKRTLHRAANIADLRKIAKRRLPRGVFDYIDGGADDEEALRRNSDSFRDYTFRPCVLVDVSKVDTSTTLFDKSLQMPLILGATGFTRIVTSQGELAVAGAAERAGLIYTLSTLATRSIEEVAAVSQGTKWFQVYMWKDRELVRSTIDRACDAQYEAIVLTADTPVFGRRNRDVRRGFTLPPKVGIDTFIDGVRHLGWTMDFLRSGAISFENVREASVGDGLTAVTLADYINAQVDATVTWREIEWLRSIWQGPIIVKGIQSVDDALIAADLGVDAIALSNHGGRQLDGSPAIVHLIEPVVDALEGRTPVLCDGGVRRGSDIVKALALGATACMIGRAYLYGLGAGGESGVDYAVKLLRDEFLRTMALIGRTSVGDLNRDVVQSI